MGLLGMTIWSKRSRFRASRSRRSKPRDLTFSTSSFSPSSKEIKTPGSPKLSAPRTKNSMANRVLPQPAPPQTNAGRPSGRPPSVNSSKPRIPVGHLRRFVRPAIELINSIACSWFRLCLRMEVLGSPVNFGYGLGSAERSLILRAGIVES